MTDVQLSGLLRFPRFVKGILLAIRSEQQHRTTESPNLFGSYIEQNDLLYSVAIALALLLLRMFLQRFVFARLFRAYSPKIASKISEDLFYWIYYMLAFGYFVFGIRPNVDWGLNLLSNDTECVNSLLTPFPPPMIPVERWYYIQSAGFYLSATVFILFFDAWRSDFAQTITHHIITIGMVVLSYLYGYVRTGILVLALHDVGDVFLYSSKFFHHLGVAGVDIALFVCLTITFYVTRLVMYPRLVHMVTVETLQVLVKDPQFNRWAMFYDTYLTHYAFFFFCLGLLLLLQCFWFSLMLRLIVDQLFYGVSIQEQGDLRSDDEEDEPIQRFEPDDDDAIIEKKPKHA